MGANTREVVPPYYWGASLRVDPTVLVAAARNARSMQSQDKTVYVQRRLYLIPDQTSVSGDGVELKAKLITLVQESIHNIPNLEEIDVVMERSVYSYI